MFTHQLDTAHQCFLQKHNEQMRNAELQIQTISNTQNEVKHAVESLGASNQQSQDAITAISSVLKQQETQSKKTEHMLETNISALQSPKPKLKQKLKTSRKDET